MAVNAMVIGADDSMPTAWVTAFKNTGISGIPAFDNLVSTYGLFFDPEGEYANYFRIRSTHEVLNIKALVDDFEALPEIESADPYIEDFDNRFNYNGIQYYVFHAMYGTPPIGNEYAAVTTCDIVKTSSDTLQFWLYGGDCFSVCLYNYYCEFSVDTNCNVTFNSCVGRAAATLSTNNFEF